MPLLKPTFDAIARYASSGYSKVENMSSANFFGAGDRLFRNTRLYFLLLEEYVIRTRPSCTHEAHSNLSFRLCLFARNFCISLHARMEPATAPPQSKHSVRRLLFVADLDCARSWLLLSLRGGCGADFDAVKFIRYCASGGGSGYNFWHRPGSPKFVELEKSPQFCLHCGLGKRIRTLAGGESFHQVSQRIGRKDARDEPS